MKIHPALRQQFDCHERMKRLLANPTFEAMTKRMKREQERLAMAAATLKDIR